MSSLGFRGVYFDMTCPLVSWEFRILSSHFFVPIFKRSRHPSFYLWSLNKLGLTIWRMILSFTLPLQWKSTWLNHHSTLFLLFTFSFIVCSWKNMHISSGQTLLYIFIMFHISFYVYLLNVLCMHMFLFCLPFPLFSVSVSMDILMLILDPSKWRRC